MNSRKALTLAQYAGHWKRFEKWLAENHPETLTLADISPGTAIDYAANLNAAGLSSNRFNKHIGFLKLFFRILADSGRMVVNPFARIKRRTLRTHSRRELTISELTTILNNATGDLALLLYLGACTGLRFGDCCTISWGNVDLVRGIIRRIPNKTAKNGKPVTLGIPPALHDRLAAIPPKRRTGFVLPAMAETYRHDPSSITNRIKAHVLNCGIDVHAPGTGERIKREANGAPELNTETGKVVVEENNVKAVVDVGFHSLRHTWVSMHAAAGTPQAIVQDSVGHANPSMTAHYTHVSESTARNVALALPIFSGVTTPIKREPLPPWARELAQTLTPINLETVKAELLKTTEE
jgi:integrase